jgi:hypothetical protein
MYDIRLFGRLEVRTRGIRLAGRDFGGANPRHILALLALRGRLHTDELAQLLWDGRPPANHVVKLERYVSVYAIASIRTGLLGSRSSPGLGADMRWSPTMYGWTWRASMSW